MLIKSLVRLKHFRGAQGLKVPLSSETKETIGIWTPLATDIVHIYCDHPECHGQLLYRYKLTSERDVDDGSRAIADKK